MAKAKSSAVAGHKANAQATPRCLAIASRGITTGAEFAQLMSTLMTDLVVGAVTPQIGNAVCNAGGKLLKVVELQMKYGKRQKETDPPVLQLTTDAG